MCLDIGVPSNSGSRVLVTRHYGFLNLNVLSRTPELVLRRQSDILGKDLSTIFWDVKNDV